MSKNYQSGVDGLAVISSSSYDHWIYLLLHQAKYLVTANNQSVDFITKIYIVFNFLCPVTKHTCYSDDTLHVKASWGVFHGPMTFSSLWPTFYASGSGSYLGNYTCYSNDISHVEASWVVFHSLMTFSSLSTSLTYILRIIDWLNSWVRSISCRVYMV